MTLLEFPDPISWIDGAKDEGQKRELIRATVSALYSAQITMLWASGASWWAQKLGEGKALQDTATAIYLTLSGLEKNGNLTLTVPSEIRTAANLSRFITETK